MAGISKDKLEQGLNELGVRQLFEIHVFDTLASTNAWLLDNINANPELSLVCIADEQTAGSGRAGRKWYSPAGKNIYFSYSLALDANVQDFSALSLVVGVVIYRVLRKLGVTDVGLKWPNDILRCGKKLAGILISVKTVAQQRYLIVGIGINVSMQNDRAKMLEGIDCSDLRGTGIGLAEREKIVAMILAESNKVMPLFFERGFSAFREEWNSADVWSGKDVQIEDQGKVLVSGVESGVDDNGCLQIQADQLHKITSGDVSLRKS